MKSLKLLYSFLVSFKLQDSYFSCFLVCVVCVCSCRVCMYACECTHTHTCLLCVYVRMGCVCMHSGAHTCERQKLTLGVFFSCFLPYFFEMLNLKPNNLVSWMAVSSRRSPVSVSLVLGLQVPDVILGLMWVLEIQFRASCCAACTLQT